MDYSGFVKAVEDNEQAKVNQFIKELTPRLIKYLTLHWNATRQDAEDCVQDALVTALDVIKEGGLRDSSSVFSFLVTTCRNNYLNKARRDLASSFEDVADDYHNEPRQLFSLIDEERLEVLQRCIQKLSDRYQDFIEYWFAYPNSDAKGAATRFGMTKSNVWTSKHRLIKKLRDCFQKKN